MFGILEGLSIGDIDFISNEGGGYIFCGKEGKEYSFYHFP
jgi:hypothetical protein